MEQNCTEEIKCCKYCGTPKARKYHEYAQRYLYVAQCDCEQKAKEEEQKQQRQRAQAEYVKIRKECSGVLPIFANASEKDFSETDIVNSMHNVISSVITKAHTFGIVFYGNTGSGKSYAAAAIANEINNSFPLSESALKDIAAGLSPTIKARAMMITEKKLYDRFRCFRYNEECAAPYETVELLIIDDLGAACGKEEDIANLSSVIDTRYGNQLPTIITTNLSITDLKKYVGGRVYDRINGSCAFIKIVTDKSRRTPLFEQNQSK